MLFLLSWDIREGHGPDEVDESVEVFSRWEPPAGVEISNFYLRADGGGFAAVEADSSESFFEAIAPWAGTYLDYEIVPIVEVERGVELLNQASAFRKG